VLDLKPLQRAYRAHADRTLAVGMRAYMRDQFPFLGLQRKTRDALDKTIALDGDPLAIARACWDLPEREYQYFGMKLLRKHAKKLDAAAIDVVEELIVQKSWWDTVDELATNIVGPTVQRHASLLKRMDAWAKSPNLWLARTAILHQNKYKTKTDAARLFRYCEARATDKDFFMRKAIGWALRVYSETNPDAVRAFVGAHPELSPLSVKEALRKITP
jgi:3-methyladenine DNA glycosylase AlkD